MKKFSIGILPLLLSLLVYNYSVAQAPAGYYDSAKGLNKKNLLIALKNIVGPHTTVSYDGLWEVYKSSDVRVDPGDGKTYVWDMYSTAKFVPGQKQCGNYSKIGDCYNREHSFPKSWFSKAKPMYSDAYHLYPTDGKVNGQRSNYPFGECANGTYLPPNGNAKALGKLGTSTFPGYNDKVFEPDDEYKGDFARSYFYMAAAYQDRISSWSSPMLARNDYPCYSSWAIELLLKWHRQDPVSQKEIDRNNAVALHQKNRNPFIDNPEMAEYIWGTKQDQGWVPGGVVDPVILSPINGQKFDVGVVSLGRPVSYDINIKGQGLKEDLKVTVGNQTNFSINTTVLPAADVNSQSGTKITVTYQSAVAGEYSSDITFSSNEASSTISVTGTAYDGIPALSATNVTQNSFTARWVDVTGSGNYILNVYEGDGVTSVDGFPVSVVSSAQSYNVTGLEYSTVYKYQLNQGALTSNVVSVTTSDPIRLLTLIYPETGLNFSALPGSPSEPIEASVYTEYINEEITVSVTGQFEISFDKTNWSESLTMDSDGERFYIRLKSLSDEGTYKGLIMLSTPTLDGDEADMSGVVSMPRTFFEDFENLTPGGYYDGEKQGNACKWLMKDVGFWDSSSDRCHGEISARFGKTATSSIWMNEDKLNGAGSLSFFASLFGSDSGATIDVLYSIDGGQNWTKAGTVDVAETLLTEHKFNINISSPVRFKFQQTEGKRINIDDIAISDYVASVITPTVSTWDAYSRNGELVIESAGNELITVYSMDAIAVYQDTPQIGKTSIRLNPGVYVVVGGNEGKKVIVK